MPSNHLILCRPLLLLPSIFPSIRVFSNESALGIRWPKYWSFRGPYRSAGIHVLASLCSPHCPTPHEKITKDTFFFSQEQKGSNMYEKFSTQGQGVVTGSCRHPLPSTENPRLQERSFLLFPGIPALVDRLFSAVQRGDEKGRDFPREPTSQFYSCLWVLMGDGLYQKNYVKSG